MVIIAITPDQKSFVENVDKTLISYEDNARIVDERELKPFLIRLDQQLNQLPNNLINNERFYIEKDEMQLFSAYVAELLNCGVLPLNSQLNQIRM